MHSTIQRHQSPERSILSQFSGFMQLQIQGREIALDGRTGGRFQLLEGGSKMTWLVSACSSILTRCPKKERRRELTMNKSGGSMIGHMTNVSISNKIMPTILCWILQSVDSCKNGFKPKQTATKLQDKNLNNKYERTISTETKLNLMNLKPGLGSC